MLLINIASACHISSTEPAETPQLLLERQSRHYLSGMYPLCESSRTAFSATLQARARPSLDFIPKAVFTRAHSLFQMRGLCQGVAPRFLRFFRGAIPLTAVQSDATRLLLGEHLYHDRTLHDRRQNTPNRGLRCWREQASSSVGLTAAEAIITLHQPIN
ncbi:KLTH0H15466p [Lachancea thermotolerans CBS 6340]|uniref:KLTH0H15466p n=1 Tax=Lachancea thermotolerans (strain ATCC 56472 / CBS 6340 / NRRL Y-8284) TaxID=559295 RepID=C5E3Q3_LACTC|nr:KLTH0H15466p [Lachancea thermotolerans CBS 6340]CAR30664.1 KLTH0H15466p [Lachancea thermotolerans CBS 6340]